MKKNILTLLSLTFLLSVSSCTIDIREDNDIPTNPTNPGNNNGSVMEGSEI